MVHAPIQILIINDDGISSPGLLALVRELSATERYDIRVVAPAEEQSGVAFHITLGSPVYASQTKLSGGAPDVPAYVIWGTPVDCVKLALRGLMQDFRPALVLSGINRGPNLAQVIPYSGTVAAALEAMMNGIPAIALSLDNSRDGMWNYVHAAELSARIVRSFVEAGVSQCRMLNINIPNRPSNEILGVKFVPQGRARFKEFYVEDGLDKAGRRRFRLEGSLDIPDAEELTDASALAKGFVTITPLHTRLEDRGYFSALGAGLVTELEQLRP
jgi:5'-nucleotidase